ncbi:hypothetical protein JTB14_002117 [Gonioctena quinquepunctata]|nr:hypothetical protein JTB14_002117 [Gonioctena quinquepunctata]
MSSLLLTFVLLNLPFSILADYTYGYDYGESDYEYPSETSNLEEISHQPVSAADDIFLSPPIEINAQIGETVWLPCSTNMSDPMRLWKLNSQLVFQENIKMMNIPSYIMDNGTLRIKVDSAQRDVYECTVVDVDTIKSVQHVVDSRNFPVVEASGSRMFCTCRIIFILMLFVDIII